MAVPNNNNNSPPRRRGSGGGRNNGQRRRRNSGGTSDNSTSSNDSSSSSPSYKNSFKKPSLPDHSQYLGLDCEMVGSATGESLCARAVLVDWKGKIVYDSYVLPSEPIADYRTFVSGIVADDLIGAPSLDVVRTQVLELIEGKIIVGHALENDFKCLQIIDHPWYLTRDTATYRPFLQTNRFGKQVPRKLRDIAHEKLGKSIQCLGQAHCPAEDARAALEAYKTHRPRWEACIAFDLNKEREQQERQEQVLRTQQMYFAKQQQQQLQLQLLWQQAQQQQQQQEYYNMVPAAPAEMHHYVAPPPQMIMYNQQQQHTMLQPAPVFVSTTTTPPSRRAAGGGRHAAAMPLLRTY